MTSMVLDQPHELTWGGFVFSSQIPPDVPWSCTTLASTDFGDAVPIVEFVESSLIVDGGEAVVTGWERRTFTVEVRITAPDGQAMAQAQQALFALTQADVKPPLLWTPPMLGAWTGAFDVMSVKFLRKYDVAGDWSHRERFTRQRVFKLEFTCKTWVRDPEPIEVPALPVPENPGDPAAHEVLDPVSSAAGWSVDGYPPVDPLDGAWTGLTISNSADWVRATGFRNGFNTNTHELSLVRSGPLPGSSTLPYFAAVLTVRRGGVTYPSPSSAFRFQIVYWSGDVGLSSWEMLSPVAILPRSGAETGKSDVIFPAPSFAVANYDIRVIEDPPLGKSFWNQEVQLQCYELYATDRIAATGSSGFQVPRTITIEGSGPTGAAITFDAGSDPLLGSTALIYTGPSEVISLRALDDGIPPGFTADATMMSGAWNTLNGDTVSLVPVSRLSDSKYDLLGRLNFTGTARIYWSARLVGADGSDIPGSDVVRSGDILLRNDTADAWKIHTIASIAMPVVKVEGVTPHKVEVKIWMPTGGAAVKRDECWLADRRGAVTIVHEPSASQLTKIELRSPQLGAPRYQVVGTWAGYGSQDISRLARVGRHRFPPGLLHVFTATDLAKYAPTSLLYPRTYAHEAGPALPAPAEA